MSARAHYKFRLYVADAAPNSVQAIANLTALCEAYVPKHHEIEIVDVLREPKRALVDRIFMTPTLVKLSPGPVQRIVGTLSNAQTVLDACGIGKAAA